MKEGYEFSMSEKTKGILGLVREDGFWVADWYIDPDEKKLVDYEEYIPCEDGPAKCNITGLNYREVPNASPSASVLCAAYKFMESGGWVI